MPCISTYIFSCCIQLPVLPIPPTCNGLKSIFSDTPQWFSQHPLNWNPGKGLVWGFKSRISLSNCSFYCFSTFEPSFGRDMLPPSRDLHQLPYPHFRDGEFLETLCGNLNNASDIIKGTFPQDVLQFPYGNMHVQGVTNDPPQQKIIVIFLFV